VKLLNIGIVGTGSVVQAHYDVLNKIPFVCVRAIYGRSIKRLATIKRKWGVQTYTSIVTMVSEEKLDIVLIANENFNHATDASLAIKAGAHVLVEKPLDASIKSAKYLVDFASEHEKILSVVLQKRFDSNVRKIKQIIENKELGQIVLASVDVFMHRSDEYFCSKNWIQDPAKIGGGILLHHAIHMLDAMLWVMNSKVVSVSGWISNYMRGMEIEDTAGCWLKLENGVTVSVNASVVLHPSLRNRIEIYGTSSSICLEGKRLSRLASNNANVTASEIATELSNGDELKLLWTDYIDAVRNNELPCAYGKDTINSQTVIDAIYRSAKVQQIITIE
jgi:predicted dehydrogenase